MKLHRKDAWMWSDACAMVDAAERRHRQFMELLPARTVGPVWEAPANVFAAGSDWFVTVALPGVEPDQISVLLTPSALQIETRASAPALGAAMHVVRLEIPYGRIRRRVDLPPGRYTLAERRLENGCLYLRVTGSAS